MFLFVELIKMDECHLSWVALYNVRVAMEAIICDVFNTIVGLCPTTVFRALSIFFLLNLPIGLVTGKSKQLNELIYQPVQ